MTVQTSYREVTLPSFGLSSNPPQVPVSDYEERLSRLRARCLENADAVVIYGDREHKGNMMFFLGFDPRFEKALLIVDAEGAPRREFLEFALGIHPPPDLLALSNIPAYFAPLGLSRERVLSFAA